MKKSALFLAGCITVVFFCAASTATSQRSEGSSSRPIVPAASPRISTDHGRIPLHFIPNQGQVGGPAAFTVQGRDKVITFAAEGLTFVLSGPQERGSERSDEMPLERWVVKLDFVGANPDIVPVSLEDSGAVISYFKGMPGDWKTGLPASSKIIYRELWPGIDLVYYGTFDRMKYEFIVQPGADPSRIRLAYRGAGSVVLTEEGRLSVVTPVGGFEDDVPVAWQEVGGIQTDVAAAYVLETEKAGSQGHVYGFEVGEYDRSLPLVLDPAVLIYCGYIGGSGVEAGRGIAVDGAGNAYVTGYTTSTEDTFPLAVGPDLTYNGGYDAFVAKVNADGTALVYCGYIGGSSSDYGYGIAVDASGHAYVTGNTFSAEDTFPVLVGPDLTHNGGRDAFVAKVNADGTALVYCGYIGGEGGEAGRGIAVDGSGNAYITGRTSSLSTAFPFVVGPSPIYGGGDYDAFVAKVSADGAALEYCGYIGGSGNDYGYGIAVDGFGNAYVTGSTDSAETSFPVRTGPDLTFNGGDYDAFVTKVSADGRVLVFSGYIGGSGSDHGYGIAVDGFGNAYVTGSTNSTGATFPVVAGPDLTHNGGADAFVAKVKADGTGLVYCGYIGGAGDDEGLGIAVDGLGHATITGYAFSTEATFPVAIGPDLFHNGDYDAFVAKVNVIGTGLVYCGYIGGSSLDIGTGVAVDGSGNTYVTGYTRSTEATFPVVAGPTLIKPGVPGYNDAFVAKVSSYDIPGPAISSLIPSVATAGDPPLTMSVVGTDFSDETVVRWDRTDRPTTFLNEYELNVELGAADLETGKNVEVTALNPDGGVSNALEFTISNPAPSLTSISPTTATAGGGGFTLTLLGSNFVPGSVVQWNGSAKTTTYVSDTELEASILVSDIITAGEFQVTVINSAPAGGTSIALPFTVAGFTMNSTPASATVTAGQSAIYTVQVTPQFGSFDSVITFSAAGLPAGCTVTFSPANLTPGVDPASTALTLKTTARPAAAGWMSAAAGLIPPALGLLLLVPALGLLFLRGREIPSKPTRRRLAAAALVCLLLFIGGCSADGDGVAPPSTGTPAGTYQVTVRGSSGNLTVSTQVTLVVQ